MTQAITAAYESVEAARNVVDELIADGFDQERMGLIRKRSTWTGRHARSR